jgi:hypothetical protein
MIACQHYSLQPIYTTLGLLNQVMIKCRIDIQCVYRCIQQDEHVSYRIQMTSFLTSIAQLKYGKRKQVEIDK